MGGINTVVIKIKTKDGNKLTVVYSNNHKENIECEGFATLQYLINNKFAEESLKAHEEYKYFIEENNIIAANEFNKKVDKLERCRVKLLKAVNKGFNTGKEVSITLRI